MRRRPQPAPPVEVAAEPDRRWLWAVGGLYAAAVLLYALLGHGLPIPKLFPDEPTYTGLARSMANGDGLTIRGDGQGLRAALWVYVMTPAWLLTSSLTKAYTLAKLIAAVLSCLVVFPTWFLARRFAPPGAALAAAALSVAGSWMTLSAAAVTENLALPLTAAALMALVFLLLEPGSRWGWWALGLAVLAAWARLQMGVLIPVIFTALVIDAALQRDRWRGRVHQHRVLLGVTGAVSVIGAIAVLADSSLLGFYGSVSGSLSLSGVPTALGRQTLAFLTMAGFVPVIALVAVTIEKAAWKQADLRSLLLVTWVATAGVLLLTGLTMPRLSGVTWPIQRYVVYTLPLLMVVLVAGYSRSVMRARWVMLATVIFSALLFASPNTLDPQESQGMWALTVRAGQLLGLSGSMALVVPCFLSGALVAGVLAASERGHGAARVALAAALAVTAVAVVVQSQKSWSWERAVARSWEAAYPAPLDWVDKAGTGDVMRIVAASNPNHASITEFFNDRIKGVYVPQAPVTGTPTVGRTCDWGPSQDGTLMLGSGCKLSDRLLLNDDDARMTFYDQKVIADGGALGRVVQLPPESTPRLKAMIKPLCGSPVTDTDLKTGKVKKPVVQCSSAMLVSVWPDQAGAVVLRFRGGAANHQIQIVTPENPAGEVRDIPAGSQVTDIPLPVAAGPQQFQVNVDWPAGAQSPLNPRLEGVVLVQGAGREQLLY